MLCRRISKHGSVQFLNVLVLISDVITYDGEEVVQNVQTEMYCVDVVKRRSELRMHVFYFLYIPCTLLHSAYDNTFRVSLPS